MAQELQCQELSLSVCILIIKGSGRLKRDCFVVVLVLCCCCFRGCVFFRFFFFFVFFLVSWVEESMHVHQLFMSINLIHNLVLHLKR